MMYMLMYSFMSPVGIGIGTVIDIGVEHQHGSSYHATVGILQVKFWCKDLSDPECKIYRVQFETKCEMRLKKVSFLGTSGWYSFVLSRV